MTIKTFGIGEKTLSVLQDKYPSLNIELAQPDEAFIPTNTVYCDTINIEKEQDFAAIHGQDGEREDNMKVSLISNLDLSHLEVGTKVVIGDFTVKARMNPMSLDLEGEVSVAYRI